MDSAILTPTRLRKGRRFFFGVGLAISLSTVLSYGQATTVSKNESRPNAGGDALVPLTGGPPLTVREEEMLRLIKGLQQRVARLEAQGGSVDGDVKPAAQGDSTGTSQARLLEASIVSLPRVDAPASLAIPTFHTGVNGAATASATIKNPLEKNGGQDAPKTWGAYTPNFGYKVANTELGDMSVSIYSYVRYLNQKNLAPTYTNYFGVTSTLQQRQDVQINKVQIKFLGWMLNPKFRYFLYAWSSNASQGLGAQVVLAGNLSYKFNNYFTLAGGIRSLPGTRSVEGNFPFWLGVDTRLITDEFFRPSYTSGIWASGDITKTLSYQAMVGNNLSTLGVSAAQIDNAFNTVSSMLQWEPTTGEFGIGFGDFENHQKLATRVAGHYTTSTETAQEQPGQDTFENTQIRLSDGSVIFTPNLFKPGTTVNALRYQMISLDGGFKYHGWAFEGEGYWRWLNDFTGPGTAGLPERYDTGYQLQLSMMPIQKTLQLYSGGSHIFGQYGNPYDARIGMNWFPYKNKVLRWNTEALYLFRSPVGYTSVPFALGGKGMVFNTTVELAF
ncbi:MAG TPA: hypothetical protein VGO27_22705 [Candidatus Acidoferrum sp.]|nr:hypothetical protein [Candidatus Acidoferrum sp.]